VKSSTTEWWSIVEPCPGEPIVHSYKWLFTTRAADSDRKSAAECRPAVVEAPRTTRANQRFRITFGRFPVGLTAHLSEVGLA
jgi:hypothetical protein